MVQMDAHTPDREQGIEAGPLVAGEVHVWRWTFPENSSELSAEIAVLDSGERDRLSRFQSPVAAVQFAVSHARMRRILGRYLGMAAEHLRIVANAFGKPELAGVPDKLQFNLSHTATVGLLAVSRNVVGVDVEQMRPMEKAVAETHFSERELGDLAQLEGDAWLSGFYRCWTRKEAILKAEGAGVRDTLRDFDVTLLPGVPAEMGETRIQGMRRWYLHELQPTRETIAALAVGERDVSVRNFE